MCKLDPAWVIAIATLAYALFTGWVIWEIRRDRKLSYKPIIKAIFLDGPSYYPDRLVFRLKNVGKGPALNLGIVCKDDQDNQWKLESELLPIGSSENEEVLLVKVGELKEFGLKTFLLLEYDDIFGNTFKEEIQVPRELDQMLNTQL